LPIWFLALLAGLWIAFYLPAGMRARRRTPLPAAKSFKQAMRMIAPHQEARRPLRANEGRYVLVPRTADPRSERERSLRLKRGLLGGLVGASAVTALLALVMGGDMREIHLLADGALLGYVAVLFETKRRADERAKKVRPLHLVRSRVRPVGERRLAQAGGGRPR
jgi:hypothetical protein